jgi:hypothetical protein
MEVQKRYPRARAVSTFVLQIGPSARVASARACPHMLWLMYPSRTRNALSVLTTDNESGIG